MSAPPTPSRVAMWRLLVAFQRDPLRMYPRARDRYGDVIGMRDFAGNGWVFVAYPDDVERVLQRNHKNYGRGRLNEPFARLLGDGLLTAEPDTWLAHRRVVNPYFHGAHAAAFREAVVAEVDGLLDRWQQAAAADRRVDLTHELGRLAFASISRGMFGFDLADEAGEIIADHDEALHYVSRASLTVLPVPSGLPTPARRRFRRAVARMDRALDRPNGRTDGLTAALGAGPLGPQAVRDEVITMIHAGHHTVTSALTFTLWLIAQHPEVEEAVAREVEAFDWQGSADPASAAPLLARCLLEAMRLYPPAWGGVREALADDELGGYDIPAGTAIVFSQYVTHRHPDFWPTPEAFDPDRFEAALVAERPKYAYFPYGGGPHLCIGHEFATTEVLLVLGAVLQRFRLRPIGDRPIAPRALLDLVPKDRVVMALTPR